MGQARVVASVKRRLLSPPRLALPGGRMVTPVQVAGGVIAKVRSDAEAATRAKTVEVRPVGEAVRSAPA